MKVRDYRLKTWKFFYSLPILGLIFGAFWGGINFLQARPQYKATAQLQVVSIMRTIPKPIIGERVDYDHRGDEMVVVSSSSVLNEAVARNELTQHPKFAGKSAEEIVNFIREPGSKTLDVRMKSDADYSDIVNISVTTDDPKLSGELVRAIVDGYELFLRKHENPNELREQLENLLSQFDEAKKTADSGYLVKIKSIEIAIKDKLRRLGSYSEAGPIARLEIPTIGSFAGPYLASDVGTGALIGFLTTAALLLFLIPAIVSPKHQVVQQS
jgi:capsular polysaccharide biosynthesis protein